MEILLNRYYRSGIKLKGNKNFKSVLDSSTINKGHELCHLSPFHTVSKYVHFVPYWSEKWKAEGLRSDGKTCDTKVERYSVVQFCYRLNRQIETCQRRDCLNTKQNWYAIVPLPSEQPICPFQKLERRWNGTIELPCKLGLKDTKCLITRSRKKQKLEFPDERKLIFL